MSYSNNRYPVKNYKIRIPDYVEPLSQEAQEKIFHHKADMMDYSDPVGNLKQLLASSETASNLPPMEVEKISKIIPPSLVDREYAYSTDMIPVAVLITITFAKESYFELRDPHELIYDREDYPHQSYRFMHVVYFLKKKGFSSTEMEQKAISSARENNHVVGMIEGLTKSRFHTTGKYVTPQVTFEICKTELKKYEMP